jgi:phosphatidylinositol alpha-1,6-mannosyltransferase
VKNILLITSEFPPLPGGVGNHALNLALSLQKNDFGVTVVTDYRSEKIENEQVFDANLPFKVLRIERRKIIFVSYLNRIFQIFKLIKKDKGVVIISSGRFSLWMGGFFKTVFPNTRSIAILHGSEINLISKIKSLITNWSLKKFDDLIAVSNFTKNIALEKNAALKISVINNGFSFSKTNVNNSGLIIKGNPAVITVGNVTQRKGQINVINSLPLLKEKFPVIHYHVVGIPTEKKKLEQVANNLNVIDNITFHGALSNEELNIILAQSKVFFMLSNYLKDGDFEGFGIALLEANMLGIPAIGSKDSGIADAIKDGFSGRLVNPHDVNEIVSALSDIMSNYEDYAANAKEWSSQFKWDIVGKKYLEIIEKCEERN